MALLLLWSPQLPLVQLQLTGSGHPFGSSASRKGQGKRCGVRGGQVIAPKALPIYYSVYIQVYYIEHR